MKGFEIDPVLGRLRIINGTRTVLTTDGTLICLLGELVDLTATATFPDGTKDYAYAFRYRQDRNILTTPDSYIQLNYCAVIFTRLPQEYLNAQNLIAVPTGADIFVGRVRLTRTTSPSHNWGGAPGQPLDPLPKTGQWLPWTGSAMMEAALGIARALHIYIEDGQLKLKVQQSISTPAGGFGMEGSFASPAADNIDGREIVYGTGPGVAAYDPGNGSPYQKQTTLETATDSPGGPGSYLILRQGAGATACSTTDPSDFQSVYSVDVQGYFGRRS